MRRKIRKGIERTGWYRAFRRRIALRRLERCRPGSATWFVETEIKYGGFIENVLMKRSSAYDTGDPERHRLLQGGDRMGMRAHGYAAKYSQYVAPYLTTRAPLVVVEVGILTGIGLALWSDLFPKARIIGLDIDLSHIRDNIANLKQMGAFREREPELYQFDQFEPNRCFLADILEGDRIHVVVDDADHSSDAILKTMESVAPHLSEQFVYFIEDNRLVDIDIRFLYPSYKVEKSDELTIVTHGVSD